MLKKYIYIFIISTYLYRWSHDDKYFAKIGKDLLSIYETPVSIV